MRVSKTAFPPPGGWSIWVRDSDDVRQFIVAHSKEADALGEVIKRVPNAQLLSCEPLTRDLILLLGMPQGEAKERAAIAKSGAPRVEADNRFAGEPNGTRGTISNEVSSRNDAPQPGNRPTRFPYGRW